jgi:ketosteroid isomerase-like protein
LETRATGDTGYDVGTYQQNITPATGAAMDDSGKFTVILKRTGGRWKVAYAIYNSDRPMPGGSAR